ncbi:MAG: hypothetical protein A2284_12040 [Deltaproteobacteria bacterium RIFOXYA12_FULL_61_11]|nr:MAG: hypothetical protein A2284_12040 [Deltaproteobacteria bacterium RIFOXYA12_FULL_61_11]
MKPDGASRMAKILTLGTLGVEIAAAVVAPLLLGWSADRHFASSPYGVLAGAVVGFFAAFAVLLRLKKFFEKLR